jgi:hypothetical protein
MRDIVAEPRGRRSRKPGQPPIIPGEKSPLDLKRTPFDFHRQIETPSSFVRREWKPLLVCTVGFSLAMLACVLLIDPAFFYPRLQTDPLNYVLKAQSVARGGSADVSWAVNMKPFAYVSMPGLLRLPIVAAFQEFDHQLRGMQLLNIPIVAVVAAMSAYIFSWVLPTGRHWLAILFAFGFTLLSPVWLANVFLPLADAPYAAFTLGTLVVAVELLCSERRLSKRAGLIGLFFALFAISFMLRFTAPVLLLFVAPLAYARWKQQSLSRGVLLTGLAIMLIAVVPLILLNLDTIFGRYFYEPLAFIKRGEKPGMIVNLFGAAFPTQIVPTFQLGFMHPPIVETYSTSFSGALPDMAWAGVGILLSIVIVAGMWQARRPLLPEVLYTLGALPVLALMMPSTTRYLMPYQPFFWMFFYIGAAFVVARYAPWLSRILRSRAIAGSLVVAVVMVAVGLRSWKTAGTAAERYNVVTAASIPSYVSDVSGTFRSLRSFLESLPKERTLLVGGRGTQGRWKAISGLDYYFPDSALHQAAGEKDVYLLVECGTLEACQGWRHWKQISAERLLTFGKFEFDSAFAAGSGKARVHVARIRPVD